VQRNKNVHISDAKDMIIPHQNRVDFQLIQKIKKWQ